MRHRILGAGSQLVQAVESSICLGHFSSEVFRYSSLRLPLSEHHLLNVGVLGRQNIQYFSSLFVVEAVEKRRSEAFDVRYPRRVLCKGVEQHGIYRLLADTLSDGGDGANSLRIEYWLRRQGSLGRNRAP